VRPPRRGKLLENTSATDVSGGPHAALNYILPVV
jgi:hypothetical protein